MMFIYDIYYWCGVGLPPRAGPGWWRRVFSYRVAFGKKTLHIDGERSNGILPKTLHIDVKPFFAFSPWRVASGPGDAIFRMAEPCEKFNTLAR